MKRAFLTFAIFLAALLVLGQDSTATEPAGAFTVTWPDVFDLVDVVLAWLIGISSGRWRQILQSLAGFMPFLRNLVNEKDKQAILNIEAARTARLKKMGQEVDLEVKVKPVATMLLLLCLALPLSAQLINPANPPGTYPNMEQAGLELYMRDHNGDSIPIANGDTLYFDFTQPEIMQIVSDTPVVVSGWRQYRQPFFGPADLLVPYFEVRQYSSGASLKHWYNADSSMSTVQAGRWDNPLEGHYYALLLTSPTEGRFLRFFLKTTETVAHLDTITHKITVIDSIQREVPVEVYVAADVGPALAALVDTLRGGQAEILEAVSSGGGDPPVVKSLEEVLEEELAQYDVQQLVSKYLKSRAIEVGGYQVSTCTFATWAGVPCSLTEATIFTAAKEVATQSN